jgi:hypothetical protein
MADTLTDSVGNTAKPECRQIPYGSSKGKSKLSVDKRENIDTELFIVNENGVVNVYSNTIEAVAPGKA